MADEMVHVLDTYYEKTYLILLYLIIIITVIILTLALDVSKIENIDFR
jgi:hypothetical protein